MIENFAANLINLRKKAGLSQKELAKKLEISSQTLSNIENQTSYPTFTNLEKIAEFFNATPNQLFGTPTQIELENSVYKTDEYVEKAQDILAAGKLIYEIENYEESASIFNSLLIIANTNMVKLLDDIEYDSQLSAIIDDLIFLARGEMITNEAGEPLARLENGHYRIAEYRGEIAYTGGILSQINRAEPKINELIDKIDYIKDNMHLLNNEE